MEDKLLSLGFNQCLLPMDAPEIRKKALDLLRRLDQESINLDAKRHCLSLLGCFFPAPLFPVLLFYFANFSSWLEQMLCDSKNCQVTVKGLATPRESALVVQH